MALLVGSLGLFVALVALWLASHAMRKSEAQIHDLVQSMRKEISVATTEANTKIAALDKRVGELNKRLETASEEAN